MSAGDHATKGGYYGRIQDIADEAFGPFPVQSDDEAMTAIERGIYELRAALATLQAENAELRRGSAPCVDDDGTPFASARTWRKAYGEASDERDTARAEAATLGDRLAAVEADLTGEKSYCHRWKNEVRASEARATAAEGERDRLRELLCETADHLEAIVRAATLRFTPAGHTAALAKKIRTTLAATPHAEGEASAPPKETTP